MIPLTNIEGSSTIAAAGHDPVTNTLAVRFNSGAVYHYTDVPAEVADGLLGAASKGKFFGENVKDKFEYAKQPAEESDAEW